MDRRYQPITMAKLRARGRRFDHERGGGRRKLFGVVDHSGGPLHLQLRMRDTLLPGRKWATSRRGLDRSASRGQGIIPERGEDGSTLHFLQWYEKWLDEGISKLRV